MIKKLFTSTLLTLIAIGGFFMNVEKKELILDINITSAASELQISKTYGSNELKEADGRFTQTSEESTEVKKMYNTIVAALNLALSIVTIIVSPAIMLAGWLMSPDWTSGDLFGLRATMYNLWITISNITYFIYAVLLIFIALATIFGRENYGYKAMLPKLALGILMVPFTWWFVQFTISLATTVTASVISIPMEAMNSVNSKGGKDSWWEKPSIPDKILIDENSSIKEDQFKTCESGSVRCLSPKEILTASSGMYGHMLVYAYSVFRLGEVKKIDTAKDAVVSIVKLIHDGFIAAIMLIVFGLLTLALIFMLLARAVMLWVYTIFSPFLTLEFVMGGLLKKVSDDFSIKEFVGLAFIPAIVGLALSFGLVIIAAVQSPIVGGTGKECTADMLKEVKEGGGCEMASLMGNPKNKITRKMEGSGPTLTTVNIINFGEITFTFRGKVGGATDLKKEAESVTNATSIISSTGGIFGTIVVDIIALLFIWMAFMAAKGVNKVVSAAAQPFEDMGKSIGKLGASLPKYTPIPGLGISAAGMNKVTQSFASDIETKAAEKAYDSPYAKALGVDKKGKEVAGDVVRINEAHSAGKTISDSELTTLNSNVKKVVQTYGLQSAEGRDALNKWKDILEKSGKTQYQGKEFVDSSGNITNAGVRALEDWNNSAEIVVGKASDNKVKEYLKPNQNPSTTTTNNSTNNTGYSLSKSDVLTDKITVNLGGTSINIDKLDNKSPAEIASMISNGVNSKTEEFRKKPINGEELKKLLDSKGLNGDEISKKVLEALGDDLKVKKT